MKQKLTNSEKRWLKVNFKNFTNSELLKFINAQRPREKQMKITTFRMRMAELKLKKCEILRWTPEEIEFLLENYKTSGNITIAKKLSKPGRKFTKKNVEKKMKLLKIKRSTADRQFIIEKAKNAGVYHKANIDRWKAIKIQEGEKVIRVRTGRPVVMIKVNGWLKHYARHRYQQLFGKLETNQKVYFKDMNPLNVADENLMMRSGTGLTKTERKLYETNCKKYFDDQKQPDLSYIRQEQKPEVPAEPNIKRIPVRLDRKTTVWVLPGQNIEEIRRKHSKRVFV